MEGLNGQMDKWKEGLAEGEYERLGDCLAERMDETDGLTDGRKGQMNETDGLTEEMEGQMD